MRRVFGLDWQHGLEVLPGRGIQTENKNNDVGKPEKQPAG